MTATNPEVKPFPGAEGALISEKLHPFETGGRGLLKDSMCFMGSGAAQSRNWITPDVWKQLFRSLPPAAVSSAKQVLNAAPLERVIEASGWVSKSGTVELSLPWSINNSADPVDVRSGTYTIQAVDSAGTLLGSQGFTPKFFALSNPPQEIDPAPFTRVLVPFPEGTVKFQIVDQNGTLLSELPVTSGVPTVAITKPTQGENIPGTYTISWTASDLDGDSLFYKVEYSIDGQNWVILAPRITAASLTEDFSLLPGGSQVRVRVTASDGINSASADSGLFSVPLKTGEVYIDSPQPDSTHRIDSGIVFQGSAYDPQEGAILDDQKLVWTSDRDGEIGRGGSLYIIRNLSAGQHVITLTATNSLGQTTSKNVSISVLPPPPNFNPDGGTFTGPVSVSITGIAPGTTAFSFYTTDGSDPTLNAAARPYSGAFIVTNSSTVKSALYHAGMQAWSSVTTRDFVITNTGTSPANPGIQDGATNVSIGPQLTWQAVTGATSYDLYLWKEGETKPTTPTIKDITRATTILAEPLSPLTTYRWQVIARNASGQTEGPEWIFTTGNILVGDVNDDKAVNLLDAILALKAIGGLNPSGIRADYVASGVDVNGDGKIGLAGVIYILQKTAGMR